MKRTWWKDRHQQIEERNIRSLSLLEKLATEQGLSLNIATIQVVALVDWWNLREEVIGFFFERKIFQNCKIGHRR